jgi:hypothetical protein
VRGGNVINPLNAIDPINSLDRSIAVLDYLITTTARNDEEQGLAHILEKVTDDLTLVLGVLNDRVSRSRFHQSRGTQNEA